MHIKSTSTGKKAVSELEIFVNVTTTIAAATQVWQKSWILYKYTLVLCSYQIVIRMEIARRHFPERFK